MVKIAYQKKLITHKEVVKCMHYWSNLHNRAQKFFARVFEGCFDHIIGLDHHEASMRHSKENQNNFHLISSPLWL